MKTTNDFRELESTNIRVFCSNMAGHKVRVSIVRGGEARNKNEGELLFQKIYTSWNRVPASDIDEARAAI